MKKVEKYQIFLGQMMAIEVFLKSEEELITNKGVNFDNAVALIFDVFDNLKYFCEHIGIFEHMSHEPIESLAELELIIESLNEEILKSDLSSNIKMDWARFYLSVEKIANPHEVQAFLYETVAV